MAALSVWFDQYWFPVLQSVGIVGSLLLTLVTVRRDARAREAANRLLLLEQHRDLWRDVHERPELARVMSTQTDLIAEPISTAEQEFLNLVIVHFHTGWMLAKSGSTNTLETMAADVRTFFSLPIPRSLWEQTKHSRDKAFGRFVDQALGGG